jgi:hypothetical protein
MHPRLIDVNMFVFTHGLGIDRWATLAPRIVTVDGEGALSAVLAVNTRTGLPSPLLILCSYGILLPLCLKAYRTLAIHGPGCAYPTFPLFWDTTLDDLEAGGMAPAGAVIAGY